MATLFLSHASADDAVARQLESWLISRGFADLFVDHSDIRSGDKWTEALRRATSACRVVFCLVTPAWLASDECFGEFTAAWYQGKRLIALFAFAHERFDDVQRRRLDRVRGEDQGFDLTSALVAGALDLNQLAAISTPLEAGLRAGGALAEIGLDPHAFAVDVQIRPAPFPGLHSFEDDDADAAIFFGRSPAIARFQISLSEEAVDGQFFVTLMAFALEARSNITQVLFFKAKANDVTLKHSSGRVTISTAVLEGVGDQLKEKLVSVAHDFVKTLPDF